MAAIHREFLVRNFTKVYMKALDRFIIWRLDVACFLLFVCTRSKSIFGFDQLSVYLTTFVVVVSVCSWLQSAYEGEQSTVPIFYTLLKAIPDAALNLLLPECPFFRVAAIKECRIVL